MTAVLRLAKLSGPDKLLKAARHNRRAILAELGAGSTIDSSRSHLNECLAGPETPEAVANLARRLMGAAGIAKVRKNAVRAVEMVFSLPVKRAEMDEGAFFLRCLEWGAENFGPVLSADVHNDEAAPHFHLLVLPLRDGRMVGSSLVGGPKELRQWLAKFQNEVANPFGLKRGATRISKQGAADAVLAHLHATHDPALKSAAWLALRDAIEANPQPFVACLGVEVKAPRAKVARTFTQIMTGTGRRTTEDKERQAGRA